MSNVKAIIPCAGFGTRVNMKPDESKEMLILKNGTKPIIEYSLSLCKQYNLDPVVITREEKQDLIQYLEKNHPEVEIVIVEPKGEWPDTLLAAHKSWGSNNILILPDTRFSDSNVILDMVEGLELGNRSVLALHYVDDIRKWGSVKNYHVTEKSQTKEDGLAWGLIAFTYLGGLEMFKALSKRNEPFCLTNAGFVYLDSFEDITRGE